MGFPLGKEEPLLGEVDEEEVVGLDFMADEQTVSFILFYAADDRTESSLSRRGLLSPRYPRWGSCIARSRLSPRIGRSVKG
jgi:hypothetical protein